ncbi:MAG: aminotransferase class V-fold PLP-dependent enzyme, partial [Ignisphaera sp.]
MSLNVEKIREDFPIFKNNPDLVYLDNAATTHKPIQVIDAIREFYTMYNANIHRGVYRLSVKATELYEEAHAKIAKFISANSWDEVIFTKNSTDAINMIAYALGFTFLEPGDEIVITIMEHHSNMLPWIRIAEMRKAIVKFVEVNSNGILNYEQLAEFINNKTKIVSVTHVSNVLGTINDLQRISKIVRQNSEAILIIDGAQSVPHLPINVKELDIDFLVFSGHKMLGPTGIGVLWGKKDLLEKMLPAIYGGDMVEKVEIIVKNGTIVHKQIDYNI